MELVSVQHDFEYTAKDGRTVSIKPDENYILVSKTNEHWWHVRKDLHTKPFYIPAQYVKQLPTLTQDSPGPNKLDLQECVTNSEPMQKANVTAVIRGTGKAGSNPTHRFSTFGLCEDLPLVKPCEPPREEVQTTRIPDHLSKHNTTEEIILTSAPPNADCVYAKPHNLVKRPKVKNRQKKQSKKPPRDVDVVEQQQTFLQDEDIHFPSPPHSPIYDTIPEIHIPNFDFPEPPGPDISEETPMFEQQDLSQTEEATFSATDASHTEEVQDPNLRSAVYVNVAQLRKSIGESPPSAPSPFSPPCPDPEGWEVHLDQDSGQEYFYHPVTGQTTWDNPYLYSPTDQDPDPFPVEDHRTPSPAQSPALSPSTASPTAWTSDWEQLVDEPSGRLYFYNAMSGETSWEPPEPLSPYPPLMTEPMSVHRFHEDGPPPLPEEDYPAEDYPSEDYPTVDLPEAYEELPHATSPPPTLPKEFTLSHVGRTIIPRANLDRSTPSGWNLNVEPSGTWVFTREHSTEQWVKSVDERGQTYYYLRDGSRSQWNLPEAPVAHGMSRLENGIDAENVSIIKNWRHSIGPGQLASAQDDGRFYPTHRRKTSDYSSDSSSTGNSPETQHNVQNLEKAGILNKTKVCENGKKVRKNWSQTWTVLLGGVLTFHKDPKSAATGASNKTNQIVPEITVDLRGATIGRASKDKSSKKNVLELKGKNGVEFLVQYDTESIINDWHKVLVDTIRQLEYQDHHSEEEDNDLYDKIAITEPERVVSIDKKRPSTKPTVTPSSSNAGENDQKRVRTKLMKFLMKRPTLQAVKEKGYIRDNVFGCHLATLCAQERTTIPSFVEKCIIALEKRGLDIDGLYRVSGNLATIQRLRFKADHEELDFEDGQWEDAHVLTGALKLFFRELPEPLFPFSHFHKFIAAIRISDYHTKLSRMEELVRTLPPSNHDTMKLLFGHLRRLIQFGEDNRMTVQNVAIVFGPTLLRPEMESNNIAMHMIFQNQIVEFVLNEYEHLFLSS